MSASHAPLLTHRWPAPRSRPSGLVGRIAAVLAVHAVLGWLLLSATGQRLVEQVVVPVRLLLTDPVVPEPKAAVLRPKTAAPRPLERPQAQAPSSPPAPVPATVAREADPPPPAAPPALLAPVAPAAPAAAPAASQAMAAPAIVTPATPASPGIAATPPPASPAPASKPAAAAADMASAAPAPPPRIRGGLRPGSCPRPIYPEVSKRLEEEGTVVLRFLVAPDGKVLQAEVEKSSGFKRLDEAARSGLSNCSFEPATVDGKPVRTWATVPYTWRLE